MTRQTVTYITFHRIRFPTSIDAQQHSFPAPASAVHWLCGPAAVSKPDGLRMRSGDEWTGVAFHPSQEAAEAVMQAPASALPFLSQAIEAWHALLCPIAHRGEVNWFGALEDAAAFVPVARDPGGTMVVLTSAGFNSLAPADLAADIPRRIEFIAGVDRVRDWYRTLPGNLKAQTFLTGPLTRDGLTFTAWRDDTAMAAAAYRSGVHRDLMDANKSRPTFDRSSFTRTRILHSIGTWDGETLA